MQSNRQEKMGFRVLKRFDEKMEVKQLLKDKKFWFASFLIAWAAALQGHMMWVQKQDSFKQKFGNADGSDVNADADAGD